MSRVTFFALEAILRGPEFVTHVLAVPHVHLHVLVEIPSVFSFTTSCLRYLHCADGAVDLVAYGVGAGFSV